MSWQDKTIFIFQKQENRSDLTLSIEVVYFSFLGQGVHGTAPKSISDRISNFTIFVTGALFFWTYSAGLVSFLTVEKFEFPVQTIEVSNYRWILDNGHIRSADLHMFVIQIN